LLGTTRSYNDFAPTTPKISAGKKVIICGFVENHVNANLERSTLRWKFADNLLYKLLDYTGYCCQRSAFFTLVEHGAFLCGVERVKYFVNVYLHCTVSNLKMISKMSTLPPPGRTSADTHVTTSFTTLQ